MAHDHHDKDVEYVGDSRVRKTVKSNIPKDYSEYPGKTEAFLPDFLLKEWLVAAVVLVGFLVLVMADPPELGDLADPTNTGFIPVPDWYFLFLYQLLKFPYTSGPYVVFGTMLVPAIAFGGLLLAPFLDTGKERRFYRRPMATSFMILSIIATFYLTYAAWEQYLEEVGASGGGVTAGKLPPIVEPDSEGAQIYQKATCIACHATDLKGTPNFAPALLGVGAKYDAAKIKEIMHNGLGAMPPGQWDASKKQGGLSEDQMNKLADWLAKQK